MIRPVDVATGVAWFPARTPTLPPATHTNSYALGGRDVVLVEPATPHDDERDAWLDWARRIEGEGRTLVGIVITHHHSDHVGGARFFADALGVPLWAHRRTADLLPGVHVDRLLVDGETIDLDGPTPQRWDVLHTPGHAPGHVCLHETSQGVMVVGDMVASEGTILIDPDDGDLRAYLTQLRRLAARDGRVALPAHGAPIETPSARFEHYVAHRLAREGKVVEALRDAPPAGATAKELVAGAYDDVPKAIWPLAIRSLTSHLIALVDDGRALQDGARYRLSDA